MAETLPFTLAFAYEIALGFDPPDVVCERHNVSPEHFERLLRYEPFTAATARLYQDILKDGVTLETKAKMALEALLPTAVMLVRDESLDPSVRVKALEFIARVGRIDGKAATVSPGPGFQFIVSIGDSKQALGGQFCADALPSFDDVFCLPSEETCEDDT